MDNIKSNNPSKGLKYVTGSHERRKLSVRTRMLLAAQQKVQLHAKLAEEKKVKDDKSSDLPQAMKLNESVIFTPTHSPDSQISDELKAKICKVVEGSCAVSTSKKASSSLLDFCGYNLGYGGVLHVLNEIHDWNTSNIVAMDFSGCALDERGASIVYRIVKLCKSVKDLNLSRNNLGRSGITWVARLLQNSELCYLNLAHNGLNERDMEVFLAALPESDTIIDLDLSYNLLGPYVGELITKYIPGSCSLQCLNLSHNELGAEGVRQMVEGLQDNDTLEELNLSWNYLYDKGMLHVSDVLLTVPLLRKISLKGNFVTAVGAQHLAQSLRENFSLEGLELGQNFLRNQGACALVRSVRSNLGSKLRMLDINGTLVEHEFMVMYRRIQMDKVDFEVTGFCVVGEDGVNFRRRKSSKFQVTV